MACCLVTDCINCIHAHTLLCKWIFFFFLKVIFMEFCPNWKNWPWGSLGKVTQTSLRSAHTFPVLIKTKEWWDQGFPYAKWGFTLASSFHIAFQEASLWRNPLTPKSDTCPRYLPNEPSGNCEYWLLTLLCRALGSDTLDRGGAVPKSTHQISPTSSSSPGCLPACQLLPSDHLIPPQLLASPRHQVHIN